MIIVFGGDFCQIILVIIKGSKREILATSFWRSFFWHGVGILKLEQNMHLAKTS
jgi:ATP-dependent DNA helicase PIF1